MKTRPSLVPALTLLSLSITSHFALADRNKGKVPIVTPECVSEQICKQKVIFAARGPNYQWFVQMFGPNYI